MLRVSVVVPVLNASRTLPHCLSALERLDPAPDEIVLVDNGSTDESWNLASRFVERVGSRARLVAESQRGASAARNAGIREATGDIIAFTDADCSPASDWLSALTAPFDDPDTGAVAGRVEAVSPSSTVELFQALYTLRSPSSPSRHDRWTPRAGGFPTANLAVRREVATALEGFDENVGIYGEDYDFCARLYARGARLVYTPEALVLHHHRQEVGPMLRQAFGFGRGHAYLFRRHGRKLSWIDGPRRTIVWNHAPVSFWLDLASADKKVLAILVAGSFLPALYWVVPLYFSYLVLTVRRRARETGRPSSVATSGALAVLLLLKSGAMTAGRWWGAVRYRTLCF